MKMWRLQNLLFILCIPLSCVTSAAKVIHVSEYEGKEVKLSCPYGEGYESHEKYLCRNDCGHDDDDLIRTTEAKKNRYSIYDNKEKHIFTVTISNLQFTDAGKYLCMVNMFGVDPSSAEVKVEVGPDSCCDRSTKVQSYEKGSVSFSCLYESKYRNNLKYICRGNQPSTCLQQAVIISDNRRNGQFRLTDDKVSRKFTVTITGLTQKDSGSYLCGVHRNSGLDVFSAVELEVKVFPQRTDVVTPPLTVEPVTSTTTQISEKPIEDAAPNNSVVFIVPAILAVLLIVTFVLVLVYKSKCCEVQGAAASTNRNMWMTAEEGEVLSLAQLSKNQRVTQGSKRRCFKQHHDGKIDQQESVYHCLSETQDIYNK